MKWWNNLKDWQKRAIKTFIQTGISYMAVALPTIEWESVTKAAVLGVIMSALASALSATMSAITDDMN